jgi:hypothetical protein
MHATQMLLDAFRLALSHAVPLSPHVLIACMPKSASSFLTRAVAELPGIKNVSLVAGYGRREQELDTTKLARHSLKGYVAQHHLRYSEATGALIRKRGISPVVLSRNLFDVVTSVRDHLRNESVEMPMAWFAPEHATLPDDELDEMIADHVMPWYIQFFASWQHCPEALQVAYEDVKNDPEAVVDSIASYAGVKADVPTIQRAVTAARAAAPRLNKGISGRGKKISPRAKNHIVRLASRYPKIDWTPVLGDSVAQVAEGVGVLRPSG